MKREKKKKHNLWPDLIHLWVFILEDVWRMLASPYLPSSTSRLWDDPFRPLLPDLLPRVPSTLPVHSRRQRSIPPLLAYIPCAVPSRY